MADKMTEAAGAWERQYGDFVVLCQLSYHGDYWYTVLYHHTYNKPTGPEGGEIIVEAVWVLTCQGNAPDEVSNANLLEMARMQLPQAIERHTT